MKLINKSTKDIMLNIYECFECHKPEYYGMFHWHDGHEYCRNCIYRIWSEESNFNWTPKEGDLVFPLYSDGIDYTKKEGYYE